jgi:hypothetical protein
VTESLQLPNQSLRVVCLTRSLSMEVILAELLIGHFTLQHVLADHQYLECPKLLPPLSWNHAGL